MGSCGLDQEELEDFFVRSVKDNLKNRFIRFLARLDAVCFCFQFRLFRREPSS